MKFNLLKNFRKHKNKSIAFLTVAAFILCSYSGFYKLIVEEISAIPTQSEICGDLNSDRKVNVLDLLIFRKNSLNNTSLNNEIYDVNFDSEINLKDSNELQDYILTRTNGFSGNMKKSLNSIDRSIVDKNVNGQSITGIETQMTAEIAELAKTLKYAC